MMKTIKICYRQREANFYSFLLKSRRFYSDKLKHFKGNNDL